MSNEVLLENVKTWLDIDNQIRALQKQIKERRKLKKDLTASLVQIMKTNERNQFQEIRNCAPLEALCPPPFRRKIVKKTSSYFYL